MSFGFKLTKRFENLFIQAIDERFNSNQQNVFHINDNISELNYFKLDFLIDDRNSTDQIMIDDFNYKKNSKLDKKLRIFDCICLNDYYELNLSKKEKLSIQIRFIKNKIRKDSKFIQ